MAIQWSLVLFTALTGAAGWMLACIAIAEFKGLCQKSTFATTLVALIMMVVGGCASVTHLSHPERMLEALNHPTSGIFVEAALIGVTAVLVIVFLILLKRGGHTTAAKVFIAAAAVTGVVLSYSAGSSYMMAARETWNTVLLPLGYCGTAIPAGVAAYLVTVCLFKEDAKDLKLFGYLLCAGGLIAAVTAALYTAQAGGSDATLLGWVLAVIVGGIVPAIMGFLITRKPESALGFAAVALVCALVGAIAYRCYMWTSMSSIENFFSPLG